MAETRMESVQKRPSRLDLFSGSYYCPLVFQPNYGVGEVRQASKMEEKSLDVAEDIKCELEFAEDSRCPSPVDNGYTLSPEINLPSFRVDETLKMKILNNEGRFTAEGAPLYTISLIELEDNVPDVEIVAVDEEPADIINMIDNKVEEANAALPQAPKHLPEANIFESVPVVFVDSWSNTSQPIFAETASGYSQPSTNDCTTGTSEPLNVECGIQTSQEFWFTSKENRENDEARAMEDSDSDASTERLSMMSDTSSTLTMPIIFPRVKTWSVVPIKRMRRSPANSLKLIPIVPPRTGGSEDKDDSYQSDKENCNSHGIRNIYTKSQPENLKTQDPTENDGVELDLDSDDASADKDCGVFRGPFVRLGLSRKSKPRRPLHNLTLTKIGQNQ